MSALTLVLLPGMEGTGDLFAPLLAQIPGGIKVQVIRYPTDSIAAYRELTDLVRQQLPPDSDYVLLGESFSGPIAIALAAQALPGLRGLILSCSFASNPQSHLPIYMARMRLIPTWLMTSTLAMRILLGSYASDKVCAMLRHAIRIVPRETLLARLQQIVAIDVREDFARIKLPILYLRAKDDALVPAYIADQLMQLNSAMQIVEIVGPHFLLQTKPDAAVTAITRFLSLL